MNDDQVEKFRDLLTQEGYDLKEDGGFWRARAVYRDGDNSTALRINKQTGKWNDFVTGAYGGIYDLVKKTNPNVKIEDINDNERITTPNERIKVSFTRIYSKDLLKKLSNNYSYWGKRGIDEKVVKFFDGGVCSSGRMAGRFVFPIYDISSNIVGFSGRSLYENNSIKWKHIGNKSDWEYPLYKSQDEIKNKGYVILVESIGDMLSLWGAGIKNTAVTFGLTGLTKLMYKVLGASERIVVAFNDDSKGKSKNFSGNRAAFFFKKQLVATKLISDSSVIIQTPTRNDFGEMTKEENQNWLKRLEEKLQKI